MNILSDDELSCTQLSPRLHASKLKPHTLRVRQVCRLLSKRSLCGIVARPANTHQCMHHSMSFLLNVRNIVSEFMVVLSASVCRKIAVLQ